jgi:hypothetical protein
MVWTPARYLFAGRPSKTVLPGSGLGSTEEGLQGTGSVGRPSWAWCCATPPVASCAAPRASLPSVMSDVLLACWRRFSHLRGSHIAYSRFTKRQCSVRCSMRCAVRQLLRAGASVCSGTNLASPLHLQLLFVQPSGFPKLRRPLLALSMARDQITSLIHGASR